MFFPESYSLFGAPGGPTASGLVSFGDGTLPRFAPKLGILSLLVQ
jgi:hypothetical protein